MSQATHDSQDRPPQLSPTTPPKTEGTSGSKEKMSDLLFRLGKRLSDDSTQGKGSRGKRVPRGDLAELRRLDFRKGYASAGAVFWQLVAYELEPSGHLPPHAGPQKLRAWMAIIQGLATLGSANLLGKEQLGSAMAKAGISEARLVRLLGAREEALLEQVRPIAHQLRSKAQAVRWVDMANLILSDGKPWAEEARQRIASSYYNRQYRQETEASKN